MPRTLQSRWLSLGQACRILGINETTLRHWANAGRVRTFRTVGGHRRFAREDIESLASNRTGSRGSVANGDLPDSTLDRMRRQISRRRGQPDQWLDRFDDEGKGRMRVLGRTMVALATDYLTERRRRTELAEEARYLGLEYGRELASREVGLSDAVGAFIFFRNSLHEALRYSEAQPSIESGSSPGVRVLEDEVLVGIAQAYERTADRGGV